MERITAFLEQMRQWDKCLHKPAYSAHNVVAANCEGRPMSAASESLPLPPECPRCPGTPMRLAWEGTSLKVYVCWTCGGSTTESSAGVAEP